MLNCFACVLYNAKVDASKKIKEHLDNHTTNKIPYFQPKSDKFSAKNIRKRKFEARNKIVQYSLQQSEMINSALDEYWNSPPTIRSVKKVCKKYWGVTAHGNPKYGTTFTRWIKSGYTKSDQIPRSGKTMLDSTIDSMVAGIVFFFCHFV